MCSVLEQVLLGRLGWRECNCLGVSLVPVRVLNRLYLGGGFVFLLFSFLSCKCCIINWGIWIYFSGVGCMPPPVTERTESGCALLCLVSVTWAFTTFLSSFRWSGGCGCGWFCGFFGLLAFLQCIYAGGLLPFDGLSLSGFFNHGEVQGFLEGNCFTV